ncbi:hypothetical protein I302_103282 [Kwoniella bestiolae CBS 10118]|uniref:RRM domain-containing protein n=1 Tax=Kwoniella bestiolae CBS 10118 TaxID=1296100 RepID=A0A1B9G7Z5_9TREE|nr:hypothetical protein I302_01981 [Kwoniella bestiolae CBS 10118]OCF27146.1 hypothetical protein I302_01981 [Kwoniella bestiolae CBS 10118]
MSSSEIYPPRARRYVDNQLVLAPRYYPEPGPEGFYPELQHPVQTRLGIRLNTVLNKEVYTQLNAVFIAGMRMGITQNEIREYFRGIGDNFIFTEFHKHPHKDFMITCMEFGSAKDADDVICFTKHNTHLFGDERVTVRYSDIHSSGYSSGSTKDILLVREELALSPSYTPRSIPLIFPYQGNLGSGSWANYPSPIQPQFAFLGSQQRNIQSPFASTPTIPSRSNEARKACSPSTSVDPFSASSSSRSRRESHSKPPASFPRISPMVPSPMNKTFPTPATLSRWDSPFNPIPTGPKPLIERIAFSPPPNPMVPLTVTPAIGAPINNINPMELTKALQRLQDISYKLNFQVDPSPGKVTERLRHPAPSGEKKSEHPYPYGLAPWSKRYEKSQNGMLERMKRGRYFRKYQAEEMGHADEFENNINIKDENETRKRSTSASESYRDASSRGRSSSSSHTYKPYGGRTRKGNGTSLYDDEGGRGYQHHLYDHHQRHGHGHRNHDNARSHKYDGQDRKKEDKFTLNELRGFAHHFDTPNLNLCSQGTVEPKYIGIPGDGKTLIFGSKRRDVDMALVSPEEPQVCTDTGSKQHEGSREVIGDDGNGNGARRGNLASHEDEDEEVEEVEEIEDEEWRMKSKRIDDKDNGVIKTSREEHQSGMEVGEEGEIIEEIKDNGLKEDKGMVAELERKEDLDPEVDIDVSTGNPMDGDDKADTPTSHANEPPPRKPSSETRVFRVSDLSSDILSMLGIELRYTFRNERLNEVSRWDDLAGGEGEGKVLRLDLPNHAQARISGLSLNNSEIEIEGILEDESYRLGKGDDEEIVGNPTRGTRRLRSGGDHVSEEETGRTKRRRRKII